MKVFVYSREEVEKLIEKTPYLEKTAVISFYDPAPHYNGPDYKPVDYAGKTDKILYIPLRDIDLETLPQYGMSYTTYFPETEQAARFIYDAWSEEYSILCQCEYGQSRSAACAAAIREFFDGDGIRIFADYRYYPNQLIFNKLFDCLQEQFGEQFEKREAK